MYKLSAILIACCGLACAQDKITVPLSNPSQPATVKAHLILGTITVNGGGPAGQVVIESNNASRSRREPKDLPPGMHRIDTGGAGFEAEEDHNVVTIGSGHYMGGNENITITVPTNASLQLKSISGGKIEVTGVNGEIEVENMNGAIVLKDVSGNVVAASQNGSITANIDKINPGKPMSFTTMDVTLPADTKAKLRLKTDNGAVYSDFDVKMEPDASKPVVEDARGQGGRYRIRMDHSVYGSINGGGPEYRFETMNGSILIHKK